MRLSPVWLGLPRRAQAAPAKLSLWLGNSACYYFFFFLAAFFAGAFFFAVAMVTSSLVQGLPRPLMVGQFAM